MPMKHQVAENENCLSLASGKKSNPIELLVSFGFSYKTTQDHVLQLAMEIVYPQ